jgi:PAS domain S-box-containing protein
MTTRVDARRKATAILLPIATAVLAAAIFVADTVETKDIAIPALYVAVVLMAARFCTARTLVLVGAGCVALTVLSYFLSPPEGLAEDALFNLLLRIGTVSVATFLVVQNQSAQASAREKASLLDLTHDTIFVRGMDDVIAYWNRGAEELYGWARDEAMGQVSHQLMQTRFPAPLEEINAELLRTGRWEGELVHTKRDGTPVTVASRWSLERDDRGQPATILETNNDVTERKRAEETLRENERRYRHIFETAGVSIWEEDFSDVKAAIDAVKAQGIHDFRQYVAAHPEFVRQAIAMVKVVDINDATVRLFGAGSKKELLGSLQALITPETEKAFAEELIAIAEERTSFASETGIQTLKGEKLTVLFTMTCPPPPARLDRVLVTIMDITERKRAEILTAQVFESAPEGVCIVGRDYRYRRANPVYRRRWGIPDEPIAGRHVSELLGVDAFERILKPNLDRCFAGEEVKFEWISESRGHLYLAVSYSPLRSVSRDVEAALVIQRDLTEYMRASEALRAAQAELAHVSRISTLGEMTASIAHEISQPLAGIGLNASAGLRWLNGQSPDLAEARDALTEIHKDARRATDVIDRIRALVRKSPIRMDQLSINEVILDVIALMRSEIERSGFELHTRLATDLPATRGDRIQLQQVILNLIVNAMEAMHDGGPRQLLIQSGMDEAQTIVVSVADSGPGLDPANMDRIFNSFYTTKPAGIGMGLSICRSIIETHGGKIRARANAPRGAIFEFTLPRPRTDQSGAQTPPRVGKSG